MGNSDTTFRINLRDWDLEELLQDDTTEERLETVERLQERSDRNDENDRFEELDRQEFDLLKRWREEQEQEQFED